MSKGVAVFFGIASPLLSSACHSFVLRHALQSVVVSRQPAPGQEIQDDDFLYQPTQAMLQSSHPTARAAVEVCFYS